MFERSMSRRGWIQAGALLALYGLVVSFALSFGKTLSNSVDMGFHLQTVEILRDHLIVPGSAESFQREMFAYPRWSYRLASPAVWAGLSSPNAIGLVSTGAIAAVWLILLAMARRISRELFLAAFVCVGLTAIFIGAAFGMEVVINYFYPQLVGEPVAVASILGGAFLIQRSRPAFFLFAVAAVWACGQFHLIPALRAAGGLGTVLLFHIGREAIAGRWRPAIWLATLPAMAATLLLNPAFAAMRKLSVVDGGIAFARAVAPWEVIAGALVLVLLSGAILVREWRRAPPEVGEQQSALVFFASLGVAAAAGVMAQGAAFFLLGESSPYAVKKHAFGVFTALAFVIPLSVWLVWKPLLEAAGARRLTAIVLAGGVLGLAFVLARRVLAIEPPWLSLPDLARYGLAAVAVLGMLGLAVYALTQAGRPGAERAPVTVVTVLAAHLAVMELILFRAGPIDAPRLSSLLEDTAAIKATAPAAGGYYFASSQSSPVVNFLVNMAALQMDRGSDRNYAVVLQASDVLRPELAPRMVTEVGDPTYDVPACRLGRPVGSVVAVDGACVPGAIHEFGAGDSGAALLRSGWSVNEQDWTWSDGRRAEIDVPLPPGLSNAHAPRVLILTTGYAPPESPRRTIHARVEGGPSQTHTFDAAAPGEFVFRLEIPKAAIERGTARVVFTIDDPQIPDPSAPRALGVAVWRMVLYPNAAAAQRLPPPRG